MVLLMVSKKEAKDSIAPFDLKRIPWKLIFSILAVLGVGGGGYGLFITSDQADELIDMKAAELERKVENTYVKIDPTFNEVKETLNQVQITQYSQISREEARRITEDIQDRKVRESAYDRLFGMSMRRLKAKKEPCLNIDCTN